MTLWLQHGADEGCLTVKNNATLKTHTPSHLEKLRHIAMYILAVYQGINLHVRSCVES